MRGGRGASGGVEVARIVSTVVINTAPPRETKAVTNRGRRGRCGRHRGRCGGGRYGRERVVVMGAVGLVVVMVVVVGVGMEVVMGVVVAVGIVDRPSKGLGWQRF